MNIQTKDFTVRNATENDAPILCSWWNDGKVMQHAGFPNGLGTTAAAITQSLSTDTDETHRRCIIEVEQIPIGEMNYRNKGNATAEIGIKICDFSRQNQGLGTRILRAFMHSLFSEYGYEKIILDTNLQNQRAQHVYTKLGFIQLRTEINSWKNQLGEPQYQIYYEISKARFYKINPIID